MSLYVLSDTHLSLSCDKPMDIFGGRWDDHINKLSREWNAVVADGDTVVIPGDISWAMSLEGAYRDLAFLDALNGRKIISRGNHDYWWSTRKKLEAFRDEKGLSSISFLFNNAENAGGITVCGSRGWYSDKKNAPAEADYSKIVAREAGRLELSLACAEQIRGEREPVAFMHFPPVYADFVCGELTAVLKKHGVRRCYYGHIHGVYDAPPRTELDGITYIIASADYLGFRPLAVD